MLFNNLRLRLYLARRTLEERHLLRVRDEARVSVPEPALQVGMCNPGALIGRKGLTTTP